MDRKQVIEKIKAMLALQESTDFEGEAAAAAALIDKLCLQYGVTIDEATKTKILDEVFFEGLKIATADSVLLNAIAEFYDASCYIENYRRGKKVLRVVGSEAQQIQVQLYYQFLKDTMDRECETARQAEGILAELMGRKVSKGFRANFKTAFAVKVRSRLMEMKGAEGRVHKDAKGVELVMESMKLKTQRRSSAIGDGAYAGYDAGSNVSLYKQAEGCESRLALAAG